MDDESLRILERKMREGDREAFWTYSVEMVRRGKVEELRGLHEDGSLDFGVELLDRGFVRVVRPSPDLEVWQVTSSLPYPFSIPIDVAAPASDRVPFVFVTVRSIHDHDTPPVLTTNLGFQRRRFGRPSAYQLVVQQSSFGRCDFDVDVRRVSSRPQEVVQVVQGNLQSDRPITLRGGGSVLGGSVRIHRTFSGWPDVVDFLWENREAADPAGLVRVIDQGSDGFFDNLDPSVLTPANVVQGLLVLGTFNAYQLATLLELNEGRLAVWLEEILEEARRLLRCSACGGDGIDGRTLGHSVPEPCPDCYGEGTRAAQRRNEAERLRD